MSERFIVHLDSRSDRVVVHTDGQAPRIGQYLTTRTGGHEVITLILSDPLKTPDADAPPRPEMDIIGPAHGMRV